MTRIPQSVKVGAHTYRVERHCARDMHDLMGDCDDSLLRIRLRKGMRRSKAQEIHLHEVLHACLNGLSLDNDEAVITALAPRLLQTLQDNPTLVAYLLNR